MEFAGYNLQSMRGDKVVSECVSEQCFTSQPTW